MKKLLIYVLLIGSTVANIAAQSKVSEGKKQADESRREIADEIRQLKQSSKTGSSLDVLQPSDFNDLDSFGKNVLFLGSLYAGTVYMQPSCAAADLPAGFAPDDKCVVKPTPGVLPSTVFTDPAWQITIPGKTTKNVIYLLLNNTVNFDNIGLVGPPLAGVSRMTYSPLVTIESSALNDPAAINPDGTPMNGSFTTGLSGTYSKLFSTAAGEPLQEVLSYASVNGRGLSRAFFRGLGLPEPVIDNLYKKDMTLKFGIRITATGTVTSGAFFYQFRALGQ